MGIYGIDFYGVGRFGRDPAVVRPDFSVAPFKSTPLDYSTLHILWHKPVSTDCTWLRLVRNAHNLSQDGGQPPGTTSDADAQADGLTLFTDSPDRPQSFTDTELGSGFFYYTMWGWSNTSGIWMRCSDLIGLVPLNWGYGWRLYSLLPMAYRDADILLVDPYNPWPVDGPYPPLQRYLQLIGFQFDFIRTELESLMSINDAQNCSGALLPLLAQQFALVHEPEIGMQQERQLVQNAIHLYKLKGSPRGLTEFASIMTSYPSTALVHHGYNVMLTQNDSAMTDARGTWQSWPPTPSAAPVPTTPPVPVKTFPVISGSNAGLTLTQIPNMLSSVSGMTNPLSLYPGFNPGPPTYNYSGLAIHATSGQHVYITTGPIPITEFMSSGYGPGTVTFRVQMWAPTAGARQVYLSLWGDNGTGTPVQIVGETSFNETVNTWVMMTITGTVNPYPNTAPPGVYPPYGPASYYWIYPRIHIVGVGTETHYLTLGGVWNCTPAQIGVDTPVYDYPRDVKIVMSPQQSNLLSNTLTTFTRTNPNPPPAQVGIGFDGLSASSDPTVLPGTATGTMIVRYQTVEDVMGGIAINGTAALEVDTTGPGATVWFGKVTTFSASPASPNGWFASPRTGDPAYSDGKTNSWFFGATLGTSSSRPWVDPDPGIPPTNSWFFINGNYFGVGTGFANGVWYAVPPQPPQTNNTLQMEAFNVQSGQPFNFSVYARYQSVQDPTNALMLLGFRWYYADGNYTETYAVTSLTDTYQRYAVAPAASTAYLGEPPAEGSMPNDPNPPTGALPIQVYPFVRFPAAQTASFLLNSAMLSPTVLEPSKYMDATSYSSATGDFVQDPSGASYLYKQRTPRIARLNMELYRWLPMGSTYTISYMSGAVMPPLDPTLWP
jgi:hypothetical protein